MCRVKRKQGNVRRALACTKNSAGRGRAAKEVTSQEIGIEWLPLYGALLSPTN